MFLQLFVEVNRLANRRVETGEQLSANDQQIDAVVGAIAKLAFDGVFVSVGVAVVCERFAPKAKDFLVGARVDVVGRVFAKVGRGDNDRRFDVAERLETAQIAHRVAFVVDGQHRFTAERTNVLRKMPGDVQCDSFDSRFGRR